MRLADVGEFGLIERLQRCLPRPSSQLRLGIGDDAAVWRPQAGHELVLTCDAQVEGRHFLTLPRDSTSEQSLLLAAIVGRRCAMVNLSDLAAMAAAPRFVLVSLGLCADLPVATIESLYHHMAHTFAEAGATIVGGNITRTDGPLFVDITLGGEIPYGEAITRGGAQLGDWIGVTGHPGTAHVGLHIALAAIEQGCEASALVSAPQSLEPDQLWGETASLCRDRSPEGFEQRTESRRDTKVDASDAAPTEAQDPVGSRESVEPWSWHKSVEPWRELVRAYLCPEARLAEALAMRPFLHAMTDISDGWVSDLQHVLKASKVGARLALDAWPHSLRMAEYATQEKRALLSLLTQPSDDYELLLCVPERHKERVASICRQYGGAGVSWIGRVVPQEEGVLVDTKIGESHPLQGQGWTHF